MSYASLDEAFGGISGNSIFNVPLYQKRHPIHQKRINDARATPNGNSGLQQHLGPRAVQCQFNSNESCDQVVDRNKRFYDGVKYTTETPMLRPQYPWYPDTRYGYLNYGPMVSSGFYNYPYTYFPHLAHEISQSPNYNPMPMGVYRGDNFMPGNYFNPGFMPPPLALPAPVGPGASLPGHLGLQSQAGPQSQASSSRKTKIEHFTEKYQVTPMQLMMIFFMFFLILLAVILCLFFLAISQRRT